MFKLVYQPSPRVKYDNQQFISVPFALQFSNTEHTSITNEETLDSSSKIQIYHPDGTYLAKLSGTRIFPTADGEKAGIKLSHPKNMTVCEVNGQVVFEIFHSSGQFYTPNGFFMKCHSAQ